eukprot:Skav218909  [mRNA]  locus=scaffold328:462069:462617:- [translate_table: standard]
MPTTPQSRVPVPKDVDPAQETNQALPAPPNPILPAAPAPGQPTVKSLSEEDQKLLAHYRGLRDLGHLPDVLQAHLMELESRSHDAEHGRGLTHGHLNRLNKARSQTQSLHKKIRDLDQEWQEFLRDVTSRVQVHASHYQQHRLDLVEKLQKKVQELETIKAEVCIASRSSVDQMPKLDAVPE